MNDALPAILSLVFVVSLVAIVYPFKPYGTRKRAMFAAFGSFVAVGINAPEVNTGVSSTIAALAEASTSGSEQTANPQSSTTTPVTTEVVAVTTDPSKPTPAEIEEVKQNVTDGKFERARVAFRRFASRELDFHEISDELEPIVLAAVRPLPASDHRGNLDGYKLLAAIRPDNAAYEGKVTDYENRIREACQAPLRRLNKKTDKVAGVDFFQHPNEPRHLNSRSTALLYLGQNRGSSRPYLRMRVQYTASTWLFVDLVTAYHDGISEPLVVGGFERDNNSTIWEWVDESPDGYQIEVLRSLANAREAILRYEGQQYRKDVTLSSGDKAALRDVLAAYDAMTSGC